jgi:hypothetical protein
MFFRCALSVFVFMFASICVAETVGRIDSSGDKQKRCAQREIPQSECTRKQKRARDLGCVTLEEYNFLVQENICPRCNWDNPGLTAYDGWCPQGCFARGTRILVQDLSNDTTKWVTVEVVAENISGYRVWAVDEKSNRGNLSFTQFDIKRAIVGPEIFPMVNLQMQDGKELSLSSEHAVLLSSGKIIKAEELSVGDFLIRLDGEPVAIKSVARKLIDDDVFNFLLAADAPLSHTIIAEEFLTGDQYWQGRLDALLGTNVLKP